MPRSTSQRIATLGLAAVAVIALGGAVSSAADEATSCQTSRPPIIADGRYQHTWNLDNAIAGNHQHSWNPDNVTDGNHQHTWNPDNAADGHHQHSWNPDNAADGHHQHTWNSDDAIVSDGYQHTWNNPGDRSDACMSPLPTFP